MMGPMSPRLLLALVALSVAARAEELPRKGEGWIGLAEGSRVVLARTQKMTLRAEGNSDTQESSERVTLTLVESREKESVLSRETSIGEEPVVTDTVTVLHPTEKLFARWDTPAAPWDRPTVLEISGKLVKCRFYLDRSPTQESDLWYGELDGRPRVLKSRTCLLDESGSRFSVETTVLHLDETVKAGSREIPCLVTLTRTKMDGGEEFTQKDWENAEVPGHRVRAEIAWVSQAFAYECVEQVVEFERKPGVEGK